MKYLVHLHEDQFYDVEVECDDEDDAQDAAVEKIMQSRADGKLYEYLDHKIGGFELCDFNGIEVIDDEAQQERIV